MKESDQQNILCQYFCMMNKQKNLINFALLVSYLESLKNFRRSPPSINSMMRKLGSLSMQTPIKRTMFSCWKLKKEKKIIFFSEILKNSQCFLQRFNFYLDIVQILPCQSFCLFNEILFRFFPGVSFQRFDGNFKNQ